MKPLLFSSSYVTVPPLGSFPDDERAMKDRTISRTTMFTQYPDEEYIKSEICGTMFRFYATIVILHLVLTIPGHLTLVYVIAKSKKLWNISNAVQGIHSCWCILAVTAMLFSQWTMFPGCFHGKWYIVVWWILNLVVRMSMTCTTSLAAIRFAVIFFPTNGTVIRLFKTRMSLSSLARLVVVIFVVGLAPLTLRGIFLYQKREFDMKLNNQSLLMEVHRHEVTSGTTPIPFRIYAILTLLTNVLVMVLSYGGIMYRAVKAKLTIMQRQQVAQQPTTEGMTMESVEKTTNTHATNQGNQRRSRKSIILSCTTSLSLQLILFCAGAVFAYLCIPKADILTPNEHFLSVLYAQVLIILLCSTDPIVVPLSSRDFREAFNKLIAKNQ